MSLEKLKEALDEQKVGGAEKDEVEIISRALDLPRGTVLRVVGAMNALFVAHVAHGAEVCRIISVLDNTPQERQEEYWPAFQRAVNDDLGVELYGAIKLAMRDGSLRLNVRRRILERLPLPIKTSALVEENDKDKICLGCPERLPCLAESRSTPEACYQSRQLFCIPLSLRGDRVEVETAQPAGRHIVPLSSLRLNGTTGGTTYRPA